MRAAVIHMCRYGIPPGVDPRFPDGLPGYLFFAIYFALIYEERNPSDFQKLPFYPYEYQIDELKVIHLAVLAGMGIIGELMVKLWLKSRDMGLTWLVLLYFIWDWLFNQGIFHVGSRNANEVDVLGKPGTIFFKLRTILWGLPEWMRTMLCPALKDNLMLLSYKKDGVEVAISGETANPQWGTGQRKKAMLADEISKWEYDRDAVRSASSASNCLFLVGTPFGYDNLYAEIAEGKSNIQAEIRRVHWILHPLKAQGLEYVEGKPTSPWYRQRCKGMEEDAIAGELDLQFEGSRKGLIFAALYGAGHKKKGLIPAYGTPLIRCWDFGGWAAVLYFQAIWIGKQRRVVVYKETITEGEPLHVLANEVLHTTDELCRKLKTKMVIDVKVSKPRELLLYKDFCDPSGDQVTKMNQEEPEVETLRKKHAIECYWGTVLHMSAKLKERARIQIISNFLTTYISHPNPDIAGPALWIDEDECKYLDLALKGGYCRKLDPHNRVMDSIADRRPFKDVIHALGYGLLEEFGVPESILKEIPNETEEEREDREDGGAGDGDRGWSRC